MGSFAIRGLTFTYPPQNKDEEARLAPALTDVTMDIAEGEYLGVCGRSGGGKSTLLRHLKPVLAPHGTREGAILFDGAPLEDADPRAQAARIGYVLQNPDNQIVTDKVWHELAFGLESLGFDKNTIRLRVAEMASFFGIQGWFMKNVAELSGGQKQLLNLAGVMAMQPDVLILDEPTAQLDPIAAADFLATVKKINRELGTTVIISEHRLDEIFPAADRVAVLDGGRLLCHDTPQAVGRRLRELSHDMFDAMPAPVQIYAGVTAACGDAIPDLDCPLTVRDGRKWLGAVLPAEAAAPLPAPPEPAPAGDPVITMKDVWFKYDKEGGDVIRDLSLSVRAGEWYGIVGGNGTGKTTTLGLISRILRPYRGRVTVAGRDVAKYKDNELFDGLLGVLPQNPQALFVKKTVEADLIEMLSGRGLPKEEKAEKARRMAALVEIDHLLARHPYDLSGGEQQRAALAKVLLLSPRILLLDEPTKGIDNHFKITLAGILRKLKAAGVTIVMVSHDIEFCAKYVDRCSLFFNGSVITTAATRPFFAGNSFYTTAANRMARFRFADAVTNDDVIARCRADLGREEPDPDI